MLVSLTAVINKCLIPSVGGIYFANEKQKADPRKKRKMRAMSAHPPLAPVLNVESAPGGYFVLANIFSIREGVPETATQR